MLNTKLKAIRPNGTVGLGGAVSPKSGHSFCLAAPRVNLLSENFLRESRDFDCRMQPIHFCSLLSFRLLSFLSSFSQRRLSHRLNSCCNYVRLFNILYHMVKDE